jgi:hypothetical protein
LSEAVLLRKKQPLRCGDGLYFAVDLGAEKKH